MPLTLSPAPGPLSERMMVIQSIVETPFHGNVLFLAGDGVDDRSPAGSVAVALVDRGDLEEA